MRDLKEKRDEQIENELKSLRRLARQRFDNVDALAESIKTHPKNARALHLLIEGYSQREIAKIMRIRVETVHNYLNRARRDANARSNVHLALMVTKLNNRRHYKERDPHLG